MANGNIHQLNDLFSKTTLLLLSVITFPFYSGSINAQSIQLREKEVGEFRMPLKVLWSSREQPPFEYKNSIYLLSAITDFPLIGDVEKITSYFQGFYHISMDKSGEVVSHEFIKVRNKLRNAIYCGFHTLNGITSYFVIHDKQIKIIRVHPEEPSDFEILTPLSTEINILKKENNIGDIKYDPLKDQYLLTVKESPDKKKGKHSILVVSFNTKWEYLKSINLEFEVKGKRIESGYQIVDWDIDNKSGNALATISVLGYNPVKFNQYTTSFRNSYLIIGDGKITKDYLILKENPTVVHFPKIVSFNDIYMCFFSDGHQVRNFIFDPGSSEIEITNEDVFPSYTDVPPNLETSLNESLIRTEVNDNGLLRIFYLQGYGFQKEVTSCDYIIVDSNANVTYQKSFRTYYPSYYVKGHADRKYTISEFETGQMIRFNNCWFTIFQLDFNDPENTTEFSEKCKINTTKFYKINSTHSEYVFSQTHAMSVVGTSKSKFKILLIEYSIKHP